ncbi:MAG: GtrA family protein [Micrococcales bacterium]|nr:GtrA family protein [Micrococcales bacterium]
MTAWDAPRTATTEIALPTRAPGILHELAAFGGVGAISFLVDAGGFNLLRLTVLPDSPITAKVISVSVAIAVAWVGNRYLTFRTRRKDGVGREATLFLATNLAGLGIAAGCLAVSHYVLGFTSPLADNISGNVIGVGLGTLFRFLAYRLLVFRNPLGDTG